MSKLKNLLFIIGGVIICLIALLGTSILINLVYPENLLLIVLTILVGTIVWLIGIRIIIKVIKENL